MKCIAISMGMLIAAPCHFHSQLVVYFNSIHLFYSALPLVIQIPYRTLCVLVSLLLLVERTPANRI